MENKQFAVGLDIGTTKIVAMVGIKNSFKKLEIIGIGKSKSLGVHRGVVNNITQTIQSIQQAISQAEEESNVKINDVVVGIAGQHIRSLQHSDYITRPNSDEVINEDDIEKLINQRKLEEIEKGILSGKSVRQIAKNLDIPKSTIHDHIKRLSR